MSILETSVKWSAVAHGVAATKNPDHFHSLPRYEPPFPFSLTLSDLVVSASGSSLFNSQISIECCHLCVMAIINVSSSGPELRLSRKQVSCLELISQGKSSWDIGEILGLSENTINFHVKSILKALGTNSRVVAVVKAIKLGLISV